MSQPAPVLFLTWKQSFSKFSKVAQVLAPAATSAGKTPEATTAKRSASITGQQDI